MNETNVLSRIQLYFNPFFLTKLVTPRITLTGTYEQGIDSCVMMSLRKVLPSYTFQMYERCYSINMVTIL